MQVSNKTPADEKSEYEKAASKVIEEMKVACLAFRAMLPEGSRAKVVVMEDGGVHIDVWSPAGKMDVLKNLGVREWT